MTIHWIGDSTVQYNDITTWPQSGMGQALHLYLHPEVQVANYARNGRSTVSFHAEGLWQPVADALRPGDILAYAGEAVQAGALPVIVTPLTRRQFDADGSLRPTHGAYPAAARAAAAARGLPCVDLTQASRQLVQALGEEKSRALYMVLPAGAYPTHPDGLTDNTHLRWPGAVAFAGLVAAGLWRLGGAYRDACLPLPSLFESAPERWPVENGRG